MTSSTSAGTTIAISAAAPATLDATGYAALTYTVIGGVESIPAIGPATTVNSFQPLNGPQEKHKGPTNYGSLALPIAHDKADAGQTLLRTAADPANNALYSIKVVFANGDVVYCQVRAFGYTYTPGSATNVLMANSTLEINTKTVFVPAT